MTTIHHIITILPPEGNRVSYLAVCSRGDFSRSYKNSVEARIEGSQHVNDVILQNALERGQYQFHDEGV